VTPSERRAALRHRVLLPLRGEEGEEAKRLKEDLVEEALRGLAHPALVLGLYRPGDDSERVRDYLLRAAGRSTGSDDLVRVYRMAFERFRRSLTAAVTAELTVLGRLAVGLGAASALEVGLRLHHVYGVPVIPGSALKGLAAHYCHNVWAQRDTEFRGLTRRGQEGPPGPSYQVLFGSQEDAGHIIFHDAWILPECVAGSLELDVMTVHHRGYYTHAGTEPPTDYDDPVPVPFLSVKGTFLVAVECDVKGPDGARWAELAMALLKEALAEWGAGAKTNAGYGRLVSREALEALAAPGERPEEAVKSGVGGEGPGAGGVSSGGRARREYRRGEVVRVVRVEDPKGRGRLWFKVVGDPNAEGVVLPEGTPQDVALGEETDLVVYSHGGTLNFAWPDHPALSRRKGARDKGRSRR